MSIVLVEQPVADSSIDLDASKSRDKRSACVHHAALNPLDVDRTLSIFLCQGIGAPSLSHGSHGQTVGFRVDTDEADGIGIPIQPGTMEGGDEPATSFDDLDFAAQNRTRKLGAVQFVLISTHSLTERIVDSHVTLNAQLHGVAGEYNRTSSIRRSMSVRMLDQLPSVARWGENRGWSYSNVA